MQERIFNLPGITIQRLFLGPLEACCYIASSPESDSVVVIDPGFSPNTVLEAVGDKTIEVIIATHRHFDHIGAIPELVEKTGAPVVAHELDADALMDSNQNLSATFSIPVEVKEIERRLHENDVIDAGGIQLRVLHTPGHSQGSICLLYENVCFSGDTLFAGGYGRYDLPTGSFKDLTESISLKLKKLDDSVLVLPGHGEPTTIGEEKCWNPLMNGSV